jgi:hypothetical protein
MNLGRFWSNMSKQIPLLRLVIGLRLVQEWLRRNSNIVQEWTRIMSVQQHVSMIQIKDCWMDLDEIWYELYAIRV